MTTRYPLAATLILVAAASLRAQLAPAQNTIFNFKFASVGDAAATLVPPAHLYSKESGYGFEPGPNRKTANTVTADNALSQTATAVTSSQPFQFSVRVPEGNYRVTVLLGGPTPESMTVKAETRRLMFEPLHSAVGFFRPRTFTVNVRRPQLSTGGEVNLDSREMNLTTHEAISRDWDDKLTLEFGGTNPALTYLKIEKVDNLPTLFITGDSTVTDQPSGSITSWGQMVTRWFNSYVAVANHAESGETLKGFLKERRWEKVLDSVRPGDYVLIEFGCNDSKKSGPQNIYPNQDFSETYVDADTTYKDLLKQFAADVKKKGAFPIIVSPSARRQDLAKPGTLGAYAAAAMAAAREIGVPAIDLNSMGVQLNNALGPDAAKQFNDQTHHVAYGAYLQAKCIVEGIKQANLPLAKYIVSDFGDFDPNHPDPLPARFDPAPAR